MKQKQGITILTYSKEAYYLKNYIKARNTDSLFNAILVDSGSGLNLIKISALKDDVIVYEEVIYHLKGISNQLMNTMGYTTIGIQIENITIPTKFLVIHSTFQIPHGGILGKPFITGNQTIINY